ncbi:MAG: hypothetical protein BGO54_18920 [Sphingobacteriales bacterium 46-32]|nr:MAG: hypothetical protein BGO54_18920 [Sphingobacteriales bacterium 46-32]
MFTLFKKSGKGTGFGRAVQRRGSLILSAFQNVLHGFTAKTAGSFVKFIPKCTLFEQNRRHMTVACSEQVRNFKPPKINYV